MLDTFSSRLKICRAISGINIAYIIDQVNAKGVAFSSRQYSRWEIDQIDVSRILKGDVLECLVDIFNEHGLPELSADWLLYGKGIPPFLVDMSTALEEEKAFYISRAMGKQYKLMTIASNYAEPFASPGDVVIIRLAKPEKIEKKIVFVKTTDHKLYVGILENEDQNITVNNMNQKVSIPKSQIEYCGRLTWVS